MTTTLKHLPATGIEVAIPYNNANSTILQNSSNDEVLWSATSGSSIWHTLAPKDIIRVDFDVFMKSPTKTSHAICVTQ